jgi:hypothetical protein
MSAIHDHGEAMSRLLAMQYRLEGLSQAFQMTGNDYMATECNAMASVIETARKMADAAFGEELNRSVKYAQDATANMLGVALAMSQMKDGER